MQKLTKYDFMKDCESVAKEILGNEIVRRVGDREIRAYIKMIAPHSKLKSKIEHGKNAGTIHIGRPKFGNRLIDIITIQEGFYSCVTLRGIVLQNNGEIIEGPGRCAKMLEVNSSLNGLNIDNDFLYITRNKDSNYDTSKIKYPIIWKNIPNNCKGYFTYI